MAREFDRKLILEDGSEYPGFGFGYNSDRVCEIAFNTAVVGYQEIVSDPSSTDQMIVMTYPLIGNYGITDEDYEAKAATIGGLIVREYNDNPSNFRYTKTLSETLEENHIPGISGVDTRKITRHIRSFGSCRALMTSIDTPHDEAMEIIRTAVLPRDAVARVSSRKKWYSRTANHRFNVVAVDCGIKLNIIRTLNRYGCNVTIVPWNTSFEDVMSMRPDGVVISNGPGNPEDAAAVTELIARLRGKVPMFGIGLGCQLISMAYGAKTYKLRFGHHGGNHPVRNLLTDKIEITGQGHAYAVDADSVKDTALEITHVDLLDNVVEGVRCQADKVFAVQYHPESAPGPQDSFYLFDEFMKNMEENQYA